MSTATLDRTVPEVPDAGSPACERDTKVLHVINGEHYAGAERVQDLLALRLAEQGFEVGFACLKRGRFAKLRRAKEARIHEVTMRSRFDLRPVAELVRIVRTGEYRLIHAHTPRSTLVAAVVSKLTGVPMICHVHSPASCDTTRRVRNWLNRIAERLAMRRAAAVVAVSESLGRYIGGRTAAAGKVTVVPNGVPAADQAGTTRTKAAAWTIGTVALFRPRKGLEVLLQSLATLRALGFPVRLRAVGAFETQAYEARVKTLACQLKLARDIDWIGFTEHVDGELGHMDLFVLPSLFGEGMPMVVLEAMAAGVPIVVTRVEGISEAIRDGIDGLIAKPNNPDDLARAIGLIVRGDVDYHTMCRNARRRHAEQFSDRAMAEGVARVYRRVLGR